MPGTSSAFARVSTAPERSPESSVAPSDSVIGRRRKYVYGCVFCTNTLTPRSSWPPTVAITCGGLTTYFSRNVASAACA